MFVREYLLNIFYQKSKLIPKGQNGLSTKDINNIKGLNLTTASDPIKTWDIVKGNNEVNDWFNSYINSPGFQRILNNQSNWWKQRHPYRKFLKNPLVGQVKGYYNVAQKYTPNYYIAKDLPVELSKSVTRYDQPDRFTHNSRDIVVGAYGNTFPFNFAEMHEYSHAKEPISFEGWPKGGAQKEALDQNKNTKPGHDSKDNEKLADIQGLKYLFYKEGIYDVRKNKDITIQQIQKLRKKYPNLRPFKQMNNNQVQFQLNNVAMNDNLNIKDYYLT